MVREVRVEGGNVAVTIALTVAGCPLRSSFENQVSEHLLPLPGVESVSLEFDVMSPDERAALTQRLRGGITERTKGISVDASTRVLAVASGKGGVGKSTLSVNLAAAFDRLGQRTGILDADVYGHSIPHMLGVTQRPVVVDKMIVPPVRGDLKLMSIGFFLEENSPVMWRGPMLHRALEQFLSDVHWGELDTLVVDMPPGTGDVSISLGQLLPRAEVIVVTTPQPAAQQVASARRRWLRRPGCASSARSRTCPTSSAPGRSSSARAAGRRWRPRSTRRCSAGSRSTRGSGNAPTTESRSSGQSRRTRPLARSSSWQRRSRRPAASPGGSRSSFLSSPETRRAPEGAPRSFMRQRRYGQPPR